MAAAAAHLHPPVRGTRRSLVPSAPSRPRRRRAQRVPAAVYRRRRLVLALIALGLVAALAVVAGGAREAAGASQGTGPSATATVVVGPGDTVWDLARRHAPPGVRVAEYALAVVESNGVRANALQPGQVLRLP